MFVLHMLLSMFSYSCISHAALLPFLFEYAFAQMSYGSCCACRPSTFVLHTRKDSEQQAISLTFGKDVQGRAVGTHCHRRGSLLQVSIMCLP